ncbi:MAG TPA: MgtC/SapB family protein [Phycisphaerae bacterium]|nr:MgtC/SapB family protein [Phycisphaerae bacterium]HRY68815.1 MgtC/SapB family protein [Phycisphaerae bacterium]HSA27479.1 MgtC/SapB family protein [Phycisphaerae bacterium]
MNAIRPYLFDLHRVLTPPWDDTVLILVAIVCGVIVGFERESKNKPAGLRTVSLICVGSTIFTLASILMASGSAADRGRIAAQIVTGIGFLGAGAIIREHGTVVGLTTGATIWTVSAIGVLIGTGYAVGGLILTLIVVAMLRGVTVLERFLLGACHYQHCRVVYDPADGKTRLRLLRILDEFGVPDCAWLIEKEDRLEAMHIECCDRHHTHRLLLAELADAPGVKAVRHAFAPGEMKGADRHVV